MAGFEVQLEDLELAADFIDSPTHASDPGQAGWDSRAYTHYYGSESTESKAMRGGEAGSAGLYDTFYGNYSQLRSAFMDTLATTMGKLVLTADALREIARRYRAADEHAATQINQAAQ